MIKISCIDALPGYLIQTFRKVIIRVLGVFRGMDYYPLVGLDVVAHEVSHGFTEENSNLIYK